MDIQATLTANEPTRSEPVETVEANSEAVATLTGSQVNKANVVISIENALNEEVDAYADRLKKLKKKRRELKDRLLLDSEYFQANEQVKAMQLKRKQAELDATQRDDNIVKMKVEINEMKLENKFQQMSISDYLIALERETGQRTFQSSSGELVEFEPPKAKINV